MRKHRSHEVVAIDDCLIAGADQPTHDVRGSGLRGRRRRLLAGPPGRPEVLVDTVLDCLRPQPGESVLDLYAGVGLFAAFLADAVGPAAGSRRRGRPHARARRRANLPGAESGRATSAGCSRRRASTPFDLVVLDPPREGARRVVEAVVARAPRAIAYVACDPAALARDVAIFAEHGYRLERLRAFDLFPMTHHVECVALLVPAS